MGRAFIAGLAVLTVLMSACLGQGSEGKGTLEGKVTIGPICPVEREGVPCPVPPEAYAARKVIVYSADHSAVAKEVSLGENGTYETELEAGTYLVDINHEGMDRSGEVPKEISILPNKTVTLNIDIDTGIR